MSFAITMALSSPLKTAFQKSTTLKTAFI